MGFHRFDLKKQSWGEEEILTAQLAHDEATPAGFPCPPQARSPICFSGAVLNERGTRVGELALGWASPFFRKAVIEIGHVEGCEIPLSNGNGVGWEEIFEKVDWDVEARVSGALPPSDREEWTDRDLHAEMLESREQIDLDSTWWYHLLCVPRLRKARYGLFYDWGGADMNDVPREGAAIASHSRFPDEESFGALRGTRVGESPETYFRTAVHEVGHLLGLVHSQNGNHLMSRTDAIAKRGEFPHGILFEHSREDARLLRHLPDPWVRPGGVPWAHHASTSPIPAEDLVLPASGWRLAVEPLAKTLPLGAPLRLTIKLTLEAEGRPHAPSSLSLKSGAVRGRVIGPRGTVRRFQPVMRRFGGGGMTRLRAGQSAIGGMTLLRGPEGALLPTPGPYRVEVEVTWENEGFQHRVTGEAWLMVTGCQDREHAEAALTILTTPEVMLPLVVGAAGPPDGPQAIHAALQSSPLRPHYAVIEARRLLQMPGRVAEATSCFDAETLATGAELGSLAEVAGTAIQAPAERLAAVGMLRQLKVMAETLADAELIGAEDLETVRRL
jgi:hypothetical protein